MEGKACLAGTLAIDNAMEAQRLATEVHDIATGAVDGE